jgi:hypothetical protein
MPSGPSSAVNRTSRVLSVGSMSSGGAGGNGGNGGAASPYSAPGGGGDGPWPGAMGEEYGNGNGNGNGNGSGGLRVSRSAVNLGRDELFLGTGGNGNVNGNVNGNGGLPPQPRKSSYGGGFCGAGPSNLGPGAAGGHGYGHAASDSLGGGGSTFDDILKGMDKGKKKKSKLFF